MGHDSVFVTWAFGEMSEWFSPMDAKNVRIAHLVGKVDAKRQNIASVMSAHDQLVEGGLAVCNTVILMTAAERQTE